MTLEETIPQEGVTVLARRSIGAAAPTFSICVPQFNRTSFLIEACRSLAGQTFSSFELCISDDRSTDGREDELIAFLQASGMSFIVARQLQNRRYDGNLRSAIALARGQFVFLLGNDDRLASPDTLAQIHNQLLAHAPVHVALANYRELGSGRVFTRVSRSGKRGSGPEAAIRHFRDFSFVSGVIFEREAATRWFTTRWDGSEMYQMFLGCRILASGGVLVGLADICVEKDIQLAGESVDSYASKKILKTDLSPVLLPMSQIAPLVTDAIAPFVTPAALAKSTIRIAAQLLAFTYAFWLVEMRRVQSWKYALSVYRGLAPKYILKGSRVSFPGRILVSCLYAAVGVAGLLIPVPWFQRLQPLLYRFAKRTRNT